VVCEAARRLYGKVPYEVQVLGGLVIHQGKSRDNQALQLFAFLQIDLESQGGQTQLFLRPAFQLFPFPHYDFYARTQGFYRSPVQVGIYPVSEIIYQAHKVFVSIGMICFIIP
jgi:hypothetical protein